MYERDCKCDVRVLVPMRVTQRNNIQHLVGNCRNYVNLYVVPFHPLAQMFTCSTIEEFWRYYSHLARPSEMGSDIDFNFFREKVQPLWEGMILIGVNHDIMWNASSPCPRNVHDITISFHPLLRHAVLDPENARGGRLVVKFKKGVSDRCWENILLALVGDHFKLGM